MKENPKMKKAHKRRNEFFDKVADEQDTQDEEERDQKRKVKGAASSSNRGQLALRGAEKRRPALSDGEEIEPTKKEPRIEDKKGMKRGP